MFFVKNAILFFGDVLQLQCKKKPRGVDYEKKKIDNNNDVYGIMLSIVMYAFGSGLMEVIMSPIIEMLPTKNKTGNMSILHSF